MIRQINNNDFMQRIKDICDYAGWGEGYISCKYLTVIEQITFILFSAKSGRNEFKNQLEIYAIILKSLSKVIKHFQQKW